MDILYLDKEVIVCIKPPRVLSTDEPGGLPDLVREALGNAHADVRTVHRLDRVVSGLMVLARSSAAASELSRQIREGIFLKEYLAVVHGEPAEKQGTFHDFLRRCKEERKTYVVPEQAKGVQEAVLDYQVLSSAEQLSKILIRLKTGRTHQIRAQFSSRKMPLVGDRKYSLLEDPCEIALWSHRLSVFPPGTGERMEFLREPPAVYPWNVF